MVRPRRATASGGSAPLPFEGTPRPSRPGRQSYKLCQYRWDCTATRSMPHDRNAVAKLRRSSGKRFQVGKRPESQVVRTFASRGLSWAPGTSTHTYMKALFSTAASLSAGIQEQLRGIRLQTLLDSLQSNSLTTLWFVVLLVCFGVWFSLRRSYTRRRF
jgi:hypothetical protein